MALLRLRSGERGTIRPGDAVFDTREHEPGFPVHVGIYVGDTQDVDSSTILEVQGVPRAPNANSMKQPASWNTPGNYVPDEVGQRLDVDPIAVLEVRMLASSQMIEASLLCGGKPIRWRQHRRIDETRRTRDGIPLFLEGTCSHFVEYVYEAAGLDLVDEEITTHPDNQSRPRDTWRLSPMTQVHAFWTGRYPLRVPWDDNLANMSHWEACLFGERSHDR